MFFCNECGAETLKWSGKCPSCGAWNSLRETTRFKTKGKAKNKTISSVDMIEIEMQKPQRIREITSSVKQRIISGIKEFDGTLGGGIVPGMVTLIGGEPGVGKSTLLLQISDRLAEQGKKVLYISGEESKEQIKMRSTRLGCKAENLFLYCQTDLEEIILTLKEFAPELIVIDSVQSIYLSSIESSPGSVSQLRETTAILTRIAKTINIPLFLIGHVTKDGAVAGPKIIEHMVDTVLYFEGDMNNQFKILRATKNRFGSTNEIGIFEMSSEGLKEIVDPSMYFISQDDIVAGTSTGCVMEGSRPFVAEVQALVTPTSYGYSQRVSLGFDQKKLSLLIAIIEKNLGINLKQSDIFIKLSGGMRVFEPALDLSIITAILSSFRDQPLGAKMLFIGEIGLNGDVRPVSQIEKRLKEARKLGYSKLVLSGKNKTGRKKTDLIQINNIRQILPLIFK
ncbi:DNA repair protein RadA [Candidatus Cloacimonadota bacterium]